MSPGLRGAPKASLSTLTKTGIVHSSAGVQMLPGLKGESECRGPFFRSLTKNRQTGLSTIVGPSTLLKGDCTGPLYRTGPC